MVLGEPCLICSTPYPIALYRMFRMQAPLPRQPLERASTSSIMRNLNFDWDNTSWRYCIKPFCNTYHLSKGMNLKLYSNSISTFIWALLSLNVVNFSLVQRITWWCIYDYFFMCMIYSSPIYNLVVNANYIDI